MDIAQVLRDILVVLVAAKVAAELAERVGVPAVVGEILAGILIGPSVLGAVSGQDQVLRTLGELGVILLLLEVGLEMDLAELGRVGRASILVATMGVVTPMVLGTGVMQLIGNDFKTSLFVGAALTATSVGITARVFGDLRALATTEARIVLGAAVADDVMGLVVLTVVVRLVTQGSVGVLSVVWIVLVALAFLVVGGYVGLRAASPLFAMVERFSRSTGTMVAIALAFTLAFAELADAAQLAPIVGAFVAGIALSRSRQSDRIRRELAPVGHLLIPVFFLQIGIDADISVFARAGVLRDAGLLLLAAVVGKLVSPVGAFGTASDKPLIGLGMLPRGEVGLIFATIGLQDHVLGGDLYAALLLVVLVTTLATPQLLKHRYSRLRRPGLAADAAAAPERLRRLLDAAIEAARSRPDPSTIEQLAVRDDTTLPWDAASRDKLLDVIERGNARSWRFLMTTGALAAALPELDVAFAERDRDSFTIDPLQAYRLRSMERLRALDLDDPLSDEIRRLDRIEDLLLAGWLADALDETTDPTRTADRVLVRLAVPADQAAAVREAIDDRELLWSAAHQPRGLTERAVLPLAAHLTTANRARLLYALSALRSDGRERWEHARLRELHDLIQAVLAEATLGSDEAVALDNAHRAAAAELVRGSREAVARINSAPRNYVLQQTTAGLARQAAFVDPIPRTGLVKVQMCDGWIDIAARDQPGLLAATTGALANIGLDVVDAIVATWDDGAALESFRVDDAGRVDPHALTETICRHLAAPQSARALPDASVTFVSSASPWHTVCEVRAPDKPGVLHAIAAAFVSQRVEVLAMNAVKDGDSVIDRFEITDRRGGKLDDDLQQQIRAAIRDGVEAKHGRLGARRLRRRSHA
jgi:Kef-type K+ transport system membrane component KefB